MKSFTPSILPLLLIVLLHSLSISTDAFTIQSSNNRYLNINNMKNNKEANTVVVMKMSEEWENNVPSEQRPTNEYNDMRSQPLFNWASQETGSAGLLLRLVAVYSAFFGLVCWPIAGATYVQDGFELQKIASANVGSMFVILILLIRLYSGWGYVGSRLQSKVVEFEETGWYDGDFEMKTEKERARDMFLYRQDVRPVENRLKLFTGVAGGLVVASCFALNLANQAKPIFNEYDPEMLKLLPADEKLAEFAASQSAGRPTYCENRYYRAVANGGQGC